MSAKSLGKQGKNLGHSLPQDSAILSAIYGPADCNLRQLAQRIGVTIEANHNHVSIYGSSAAKRRLARDIIGDLLSTVKEQKPVTEQLINSLLAQRGGATYKENAGTAAGKTAADAFNEAAINLKGGQKITPRNQSQHEYVEALQNYEVIFGIGPAGTGKTYLAVAYALNALDSGSVKKIILTRPAVEAGERLGFLPGDMKEKVDPYMRPIYDALYEMKGKNIIDNLIKSGTIEIAPLAFMRGRTLKSAVVILDEAQNTTHEQMKMFLTRMGEGSKMIVTGDVTQIDLPRGTDSGLKQALRAMQDVEGVSIHKFETRDVVRHHMVSRMVNAYTKLEL